MSRDRDRQLEQALTHELRAAGTPDPDACADAETLGAWADGGLAAARMAAVESHVSSCARCQAIAGAMARSAPPAPGIEGAGTFVLWRWWLAPLAATAAAATLWVVVPQERSIAVAPPPFAAPAQETLARSQPKEQALPIEPSPAKPAEARDASADRARRANTPQQADATRRERALSEQQEVGFAAGKEAGLAANKQDPDASKLLQDTNAIAGTASAAAAPSAPAVAELRKSARPAEPIAVVSPDPASRWRIVTGAIERSEDAGASWTAVHPLAGELITGGTAPSRSVCWLIGSSGLVMVSTDGLTFARVPLPERVDLTAVTATDARTAIVTTADGRRFRTDDAGRTWRRN